jgi:hypothetical protein
MIRFTSLTVRNFLSYGAEPTVIPLERVGTTLILGEDLDNTSGGTGANGVGKAQPLYSRIKTPRGWTTMGEIAVGDLITTPSGDVAAVSGIFPQGKRPVYRLTFADGRTVDADENHIWKVQSHRWGGQDTRGEKFLTTKQLIRFVEEAKEKKKAWYNISVPRIKHCDVLGDAELPLDPYVLGALLGDGCLSTQQPRFSTMDPSIVQLMKEGLADTDASFYKEQAQADYRINGIDLIEILEDLSLRGTKSNTKFIPSTYLEGPSLQQKLRLLQGLLDTDGTVGKTKNISFSTVSKQLAEDVQYLVRSIGGAAKITTRAPRYTYKGEVKQGQLAYNVSIDYRSPRDLFTLDRKLERLSEVSQYADAGLRITDIQRVDDVECQCIMINHPDHLYITDEFVTTHNTVIINALTYGVYDRPVSNISKDNLVNNVNKKHMEVVVEFYKGDTHYLIRRVRKAKSYAAGNYVELFENGEDITPDSVANTNKHIESIIGLPYELFVRIVVFSATNVPFLDLPVRSQTGPNQMDIIEELFDLKQLAAQAKVLKDQIKAVETTITTKQERNDLLEAEKARHDKQLQSAKTRVENWEKGRTADIAELQRKLARVSQVDVDEQRQLHEQLIEIDDELEQALKRQRELEREFKKVRKTKSTAEHELDHYRDDRCPTCLQQYDGAKEKIHVCEEQLTHANADLEGLTEQIANIDQLVAEWEAKRTEVKNQITVSDLQELMETKSKSSEYLRRIEELHSAGNPFEEPLQELQEVELPPVDHDEVDKLITQRDHMKFLLKLLTRNDSFVRKVLLNKTLPFLNKRLQHYLTSLGLAHQVEFTHDMTAKITEFGREMDFGNLSNGQRARVNIALSFAFRDVVQSMHTRINICMLDEVLDVGLDSVGVTAAARMIKRKARDEQMSLYIISHRDEIDSAFDSVMTVQKRDGFSRIFDNE